MPLASLRVTNLKKSYDDRAVIDIPDLEIRPGELTCILGHTGCGKSTLLNILAGVEVEFSGKVHFSPGKPNRISYQFQKDLLLPWKTVKGNVAIPFDVAQQTTTERELDIALSDFNLSSFGNNYPATLSVGMRQRTALARALIWDGELVLLDEPLSSQDFGQRLKLEQLIRDRLTRDGTIGIIVTHNLEEAVVLADRVIVLGGCPGRVIDDFMVTGFPKFNRPIEARKSRFLAEAISRASKALVA